MLHAHFSHRELEISYRLQVCVCSHIVDKMDEERFNEKGESKTVLSVLAVSCCKKVNFKFNTRRSVEHGTHALTALG